MDLDGDAVPYHELLGLARDEGLIALDVHVIQAPGEANGSTAVVQATARTRESSFAAVGEASAAATPPDWHPFLLTLAELRAKARALRELTGLEHTVSEELATPYLRADRPAEPAPGSASPLRAPHNNAGGGSGGALAGRTERNGAASTPARRPATPAVSSPGGDMAGEAGADVAGEAGPSEQETHPDDVTAPHPVVAPGQRQAEPAAPRDEPDGEGIDREMEAKLLKLAISIAALEGTNLSDAEARQKLDDFFVRAFKRPLKRATRSDGQRVVQRLSSELSRLRAASQNVKT